MSRSPEDGRRSLPCFLRYDLRPTTGRVHTLVHVQRALPKTTYLTQSAITQSTITQSTITQSTIAQSTMDLWGLKLPQTPSHFTSLTLRHAHVNRWMGKPPPKWNSHRPLHQPAVRFCVSLNNVSSNNAAAALGGAKRPILGEAAEDVCTLQLSGICMYLHTYKTAVQITAPYAGPSAQLVNANTTFGCCN
jgi:hypothetical protein